MKVLEKIMSVALVATVGFGFNVPNIYAAQPAAGNVSGMVDLTYAAENTVNSVVYIKVTMNSKTLLNTRIRFLTTSSDNSSVRATAEHNAVRYKRPNVRLPVLASSFQKTVISLPTTTSYPRLMKSLSSLTTTESSKDAL